MKLDRITVDPRVCEGQATLRGMRYTVSLVLKALEANPSHAEVLKEYPGLEEEDIRQALAYAAWLASEKTYPRKRRPSSRRAT